MNSGVMIINKPAGMSSFDVIRQLRRVSKEKKMGHTGTLDPFCTGVLVVCLNKATRVIPMLASDNKSYVAHAKLGEKTDTGDIDGEIIETAELPTLNGEIIAALEAKVMNIIEQTPPIYSAIKVNGKRAYQLARENKEVVLEPRAICIHNFKILSFTADTLTYQVTVSKGTYIRTLSEQIAELLGTIAYTQKLERIAAGNIEISQTCQLESLTADNWQSHLLDIATILPTCPRVFLDDRELEQIANGIAIACKYPDTQTIMLLNSENRCAGFGEISAGTLQPRMVLI